MFGYSQKLLWLAEALVLGRSFVCGRIFGYFDNRRFGFGRRSIFPFRLNTGIFASFLEIFVTIKISPKIKSNPTHQYFKKTGTCLVQIRTSLFLPYLLPFIRLAVGWVSWQWSFRKQPCDVIGIFKGGRRGRDSTNSLASSWVQFGQRLLSLSGFYLRRSRAGL